MRIYKSVNFADAYKNLLYDLLKHPEYICSPRGIKIHEIMNASIVISNPLSGLYSNERRSSQLKYIAAELLYYFNGRNDLKFIEKYAKFWGSIANEDGTVNSAYGNLIFSKTNEHGFNQYNWAYNCLKKDKDSRQAIMHFNMPEHQYESNKDFVCTLNGIFHIRENKLNFTVFMRSNDAILGLPTDVAFFTILQQQMCKHLKETFYPDLTIGTYTHQASSMHLYDRNFELVSGMLKQNFTQSQNPIIKRDLINVYGNPSPEISNMMELVEKGETVKPNDYSVKSDVIDWIGNWIEA